MINHIYGCNIPATMRDQETGNKKKRHCAHLIIGQGSLPVLPADPDKRVPSGKRKLCQVLIFNGYLCNGKVLNRKTG